MGGLMARRCPLRLKISNGVICRFLFFKYIDVHFATRTSNNPSIKWSSLLKQRTVSRVQATLPYQQTNAYEKCRFSVLMVSIRMIGQIKFRIKYFVMKAMAWGKCEGQKRSGHQMLMFATCNSTDTSRQCFSSGKFHYSCESGFGVNVDHRL